MKYLIATIAALVFIACVAKVARSAEALEIRVIDGDTFDARPKLEFGVLLGVPGMCRPIWRATSRPKKS